MKYLIQVYVGDAYVDDIDHLGNRRVRSVGELMSNTLKTAFSRMSGIAKERMSLKETDTIKAARPYFDKAGCSRDKRILRFKSALPVHGQVNPLAELTHKRRLNASWSWRSVPR
jgi:DNA-directed RNA polymerase subunit beta